MATIGLRDLYRAPITSGDNGDDTGSDVSGDDDIMSQPEK